MMEPHCFDPSVTPVKTCKTPPPLTNGFVWVSASLSKETGWGWKVKTPSIHKTRNRRALIQFKFICIALFTIQIVAKQLYKKI